MRCHRSKALWFHDSGVSWRWNLCGLRILSRFVRGDEAAFEQLFRQFEADVSRWIRRIVRDAGAADDVLIETFWRAYRGRARFDPSRSFGAWLRRIATNASLDALRSARSRERWLRADDALEAPDVPDRETRESIVRAFRRLPPKLQVVALLALPSARESASRDLWPAVVERCRKPPRFSSTDLGIAAFIVIMLLVFPKWFWFLAYHL